jgi:hypothetical protein
VRVLLQRTLQRDARQRLRDIGEARVALTAMNEVFVQPFPVTGGRGQVSSEGAEWIEWRKQRLYHPVTSG